MLVREVALHTGCPVPLVAIEVVLIAGNDASKSLNQLPGHFLRSERKGEEKIMKSPKTKGIVGCQKTQQNLLNAYTANVLLGKPNKV
mmetsp:Transcript_26215/g.75714  ORF Transcript_26215/g.75714 Transcript_26215/m.75714 type:complete len:87 (+) Transcript_26215:2691-2951(+)